MHEKHKYIRLETQILSRNHHKPNQSQTNRTSKQEHIFWNKDKKITNNPKISMKLMHKTQKKWKENPACMLKVKLKILKDGTTS